MKQTPGIFSVIQNDSWAAPVIGSFIFALTITSIVYLTKGILGSVPDNVNPVTFVWMTGILFPISIIVTFWRMQYVTAIFENGMEVTAQVIKSSIFRSAWTLKLQYTYLGQQFNVDLKQVITGKTKSMLNKKELVLIVDQKNKKNILLRDAYL